MEKSQATSLPHQISSSAISVSHERIRNDPDKVILDASIFDQRPPNGRFQLGSNITVGQVLALFILFGQYQALKYKSKSSLRGSIVRFLLLGMTGGVSIGKHFEVVRGSVPNRRLQNNEQINGMKPKRMPRQVCENVRRSAR